MWFMLKKEWSVDSEQLSVAVDFALRAKSSIIEIFAEGENNPSLFTVHLKKMFLHAGENTVINKKDIIGIFDSDTSTMSEVTRKTLKKAQGEGRVVNIALKLPKSYILTEQDGRLIFYMSPVSSGILKKRNNGKIQDNYL